MATRRWAIIRRDTVDKTEKVISVQQRDERHGRPPLPGLRRSSYASFYSAEPVADGVLPGMVRGGKHAAIDGFGYAQAHEVPARIVPPHMAGLKRRRVGAGPKATAQEAAVKG